MFAIRIDLLTGRYAASRFNDRNDVEWPPHPARLYSAMVAMWADEAPPDPAKRRTLEWLETLPAPSVAASRAHRRHLVTHYVPDNDVRLAVDTSRLYRQMQDAADVLLRTPDEAGAHDPPLSARKVIETSEKTLAELRAKAEVEMTKTSMPRRESTRTMNDALAILPELRGKQGRTFPVVLPEHPVVHFIWPDAELPAEHRRPLEALLHSVARLGHSSSLVSCELTDAKPQPTLLPDPAGPQQLRVPAPGLLEELEASFGRHAGADPRSLPAMFGRYSVANETAPVASPSPALGGDWTVLEIANGRPPSLVRALALTTAVRGALQHHASEPVAEIISGHRQGAEGTDGTSTSPSSSPHLAVIPLAFVGRLHADGGIRGIALVLPKAATFAERFAVTEAVARWQEAGQGDLHLWEGSAGRMKLRIPDQQSVSATLARWTWCRESTTWGTVVPTALDRFAGPLWHPSPAKHRRAEASAIETVARSCRYSGLPQPSDVQLCRASPVIGAPALGAYPVYQSPGKKLRRQTVHVRLSFSRPVRGPVLIGAGRYLGYGLCLPLDPAAAANPDRLP